MKQHGERRSLAAVEDYQGGPFLGDVLIPRPLMGATAVPDPLVPQTLDVVPSSPSTAIKLEIDKGVKGSIDTRDEVDWYAVDLVAGRTYFFDLEGKPSEVGTLIDPYLTLYDENGRKVTEDDDSGKGPESCILFTANRTGRFYLAASAFRDLSLPDSDVTGTYIVRMRVESVYAPDAPPIKTSELPTDPLFVDQWHLQNGNGGVNAIAVWADYTGKGVRVGVFDSGIDFGNRDLDDNIDKARSINAEAGISGGRPLGTSDNHGTAVAGCIAAERNGYGGVGVAYGAKLVSLYDPLSGNSLLRSAALNYTYAINNVDVINNSWSAGNAFKENPNSAFIDNPRSPSQLTATNALISAIRSGRNGLGLVIVQSSGNMRQYGDNTNNAGSQNNRFTITVAATDQLGLITDFSTPGATVLVSAPGRAVLTTDRDGLSGYTDTDTTYATGTSFSAPITAGVVALMLEANSKLGYRDVSKILALSARRSDPGGNWLSNGSKEWNGGTMQYSQDYGFGMVDARAAVRLAETWTAQSTFANEAVTQGALAVGGTIADNDSAGISSQITLANTIRIERVEVDIKIAHKNIGDLTILLVAPTGATFTLFNKAGKTTTRAGSTQDNIDFTFGVAGLLGASSGGTWTLKVVDSETGAGEKGENGQLISWSLRTYGEQLTANAYYVFTDRFGRMAAADPSRARLTDTDGGIDTINASAVSTSMEIDLSGATTSWIDGAAVTIQANVFEVVYGGDGADILTAGSNGARMGGGRGNDVIRGGTGFDEAVFIGKQSDYAIIFNVDGSITVARDGDVDRVTQVERLIFADKAVAVPGTAWQTRLSGFTATAGGNSFSVTQVPIVSITDAVRGQLTSKVRVNGADITGVAATLKAGWKIGTTLDIDGNGSQEIFFFGVDQVQGVGKGFGATWELGADGKVARTQVHIQMSRDGWEVAGGANVNGRVGDEILWQNTLTGEKAIWSDTNRDGVLDLGQTIGNMAVSTDQRIVGTADMDGDGRREILVFDDRTRKLLVHYTADLGNGAINSVRTETFDSWTDFQAATRPQHGLTIFGLPPV